MSTSQVGLSGMTCLKSLPCRVLKNSSSDSDGTGGDIDACHILEIGKLRSENEKGLPQSHIHKSMVLSESFVDLGFVCHYLT